MSPIQSYRKDAERCRRLASEVKDPRQRAAWLRLGEDWLRLAEQVERHFGLGVVVIKNRRGDPEHTN